MLLREGGETCLDRCCDLELVPYGLLMMVETLTLVG